MEFRRIPPRYLAVYPSIKELSDNNPRLKSRALWGFAIAAVRNDIRRETLVVVVLFSTSKRSSGSDLPGDSLLALWDTSQPRGSTSYSCCTAADCS
jgi:hypothetical protein